MPESPVGHHSLYQRTLSILFVVAIWVPVLGMVFRLDPTPMSAPRLAPAPTFAWNVATLRQLPWVTITYVKDRFGFRAWMLRVHGRWKVHGLGISPNREVLLGKDGWLFLAGERSMDSYRCVDPFEPPELQAWAAALESRRSWLARQGIDYLLVLMPDKQTIYEEYLPDRIRSLPRPSRREQLVQYLGQHTSVDVLDLTPAVRQAKSRGRLYHRTDTHWNALGAFAGARALGEHLQAKFGDSPSATRPPIRVDDWDEFAVDRQITASGDLARLMGLKYDLSEEQLLLTRIVPLSFALDDDLETFDIGGGGDLHTKNPGASIERVVAFRDSFAAQWIPFVWQYFADADWSWTYGFDTDRIQRLHPKLVIQQLVERKLMVLEPEPLAE